MAKYTSKYSVVVDGKEFQLRHDKPGYPPFIILFKSAVDYLEKLMLSTTAHRIWFWMLARMKAGNFVDARRKQLAEALKTNERAISRALEELRSADLIRGGRGSYIINPLIATCGSVKTWQIAMNAYDQMSMRLNLSPKGTNLSPCEPGKAIHEGV